MDIQTKQILDPQQLQEAARYVRSRIAKPPKTALILGSGMGALAEGLDQAEAIFTKDIPHYPTSTVLGHKGRWIAGKSSGIPVLAIQGRVHAYEGYGADKVAFPVHLLAEIGVERLVVTNAAGAINRFYAPGHFMVIVDQINLTFGNPLFGPNLRQYGPRFPDMVSEFDPEYVQIALQEGLALGLPVHKGVYLGVLGPSYETAAEIRMGERIGADAVGMSTVYEVITAAYRGLRVLGISMISNMATGMGQTELTHNEVVQVAGQVEEKFSEWIVQVLAKISG